MQVYGNISWSLQLDSPRLGREVLQNLWVLWGLVLLYSSFRNDRGFTHGLQLSVWQSTCEFLPCAFHSANLRTTNLCNQQVKIRLRRLNGASEAARQPKEVFPDPQASDYGILSSSTF